MFENSDETMESTQGKFIELIQQFPQLWDKRNPLFKDKLCNENSWKKISEVISIPVPECQQLWGTIRARYTKERKAQKSIPSGSGQYKCKWPYYDLCHFLDGVIAMRRTTGSFIKKAEEPLPGCSSWESITVLLENEEEDTTKPDSPITSPSSPPPLSPPRPPSQPTPRQKKRKRQEDDAVQGLLESCSMLGQQLSTSLQQPAPPSNANYHFAMTMYHEMERMSVKQQDDFKGKVNNLMYSYDRREKK